ncbi:MAG: metallophosphoesterase [Actinomycetota bacterium]
MRLRYGLAAAAGAAAYALVEPHRPRLVRQEIPVAPACPPLSILHLSDTHLTERTRGLARFLTDLPQAVSQVPDLVLATGDLIDSDDGIEPLLRSVEGLRARLGRFYVLGSHDYYQAIFKPPTKYFKGPEKPSKAPRADVDRLEAGLASQGWTSLVNRTEVLPRDDGTIRLAGVDDPYLKRQRTDHIRRGANDVLAIGLTHAPDVVSEWALNGYDLILAGHTHGGQVRFPLVGAVVTNSSLPTALASGPHRIDGAWLHVSPGLGTSKFSPFRFLARPEATLLHLVPTAERATDT